MLRQRFEYDGGRRGPMLFIGTINRSWRDYVDGNARANDLVTGTCSSSREAGRAVVHMQVSAGRGATSGNQLELNRQYTDRGLRAVADATSLPQVFINGSKIGGADDLEQDRHRHRGG